MDPVRVDPTQSEPSGASPHPSLEQPALLFRPSRAWACTLYPEACEGTLWHRILPAIEPPGPPVEPTDDERAAVAADSARRAGGEVRRYIRANRLDHMWTFTFAEAVHDYAALAPIITAFLNRLWDSGFRGALVLVPEPHPLGHGWHLHGALRGRYPHRQMKRLWGRGRVHVTGPRSGRRGGWDPRRLSRYLAKYLVKELAPAELAGCTPRAKGAHRYFRTQGHEPRAERWGFDSLAEAIGFIERHMGKPAVVLPLANGDAFRPEGWWMEWADPPPRRPFRSP